MHLLIQRVRMTVRLPSMPAFASCCTSLIRLPIWELLRHPLPIFLSTLKQKMRWLAMTYFPEILSTRWHRLRTTLELIRSSETQQRSFLMYWFRCGAKKWIYFSLSHTKRHWKWMRCRPACMKQLHTFCCLMQFVICAAIIPSTAPWWFMLAVLQMCRTELQKL